MENTSQVHGKRWLALSAGTVVLGLAFNIANQKWGTNFPNLLLVALFVFALCCFIYWLWTSEAVQVRKALVYTYPNMSMVLFLVIGGLVGVSFGFLLWWSLSKEPLVVAQEPTAPAENQTVTPQNLGFVATIKWLALGQREQKGQKYTTVTCMIEISNLGQPSVAKDWALSLKFNNEAVFAVAPANFSDKITLGRMGDKDSIQIGRKDQLDEKTINLVQTGALVRGYLIFLLPYKREEIDRKETTLHIIFKDVANKEYEIVYDGFPIPPSADGYELGRFPGVDSKKIPRKDK